MERTILIIEDEKLIIVSTQMVLEAAGFRVESAMNGEEGIAKARELNPSLILLDIMMPGIDGWETLTRLKRDPETANISVIIQLLAPGSVVFWMSALGHKQTFHDYLPNVRFWG